MDTIDQETAELLIKRVYDIAGTVPHMDTYLDNTLIHISSFKQYTSMFLKPLHQVTQSSMLPLALPLVYDMLNPSWEYAFTVSDDGFEHVSFANWHPTTRGGTHVDLVAKNITEGLSTYIQLHHPDTKFRPTELKKHIRLFLNVQIENPRFKDQDKDALVLSVEELAEIDLTIFTNKVCIPTEPEFSLTFPISAEIC